MVIFPKEFFLICFIYNYAKRRNKMASEYYSLTVETPIFKVWENLKNPANWLLFLPGFKQLTQLSPDSHQVNLSLLLGSVERDTLLTFHFTTDSQQNLISFTFSSTNGKVTGYGKLSVTALSNEKTLLETFLDITLKGKTSLLLAPALSSIKKKWAYELLTQMKEFLEQKNE